MDDNKALKYPLGWYKPPEVIDQEIITSWISEIAQFPSDLRSVSIGLTADDLEKTYRPGSWNIRQIINHLGDSHLNSYVRFKWTITENTPVIKAYDEKDWAETNDAMNGPIDVAVDFIEALHKKWIVLLNSLEADDWDKEFEHPENGRKISLKWNLGLYAWHGQHHLEHIRIALKN